MRHLILLDYNHLDNGAFLKGLAKIVAQKNLPPCLFLHGGSEYTERIMQLGVMREDAEIRAIKELNHRLAALFGDEGIPIIALNGYQRSLIQVTDEKEIKIDSEYLKKISGKTHMLLSCLGMDAQKKIIPVNIQELLDVLVKELNISNIYVFSETVQNPVLIQNEETKIGLPKEIGSFKGEIKLLGSDFLISGKLW